MYTAKRLRSFLLALLATNGVFSQQNTCNTSQPQYIGAQCIRRQGADFASAYCSSIVPISQETSTSTRIYTRYESTSADRHVQSTVISHTFETTSTIIVSETRPSTRTVSDITIINGTGTFTSISVITDTCTTYVATSTTTSIRTAYVYTCNTGQLSMPTVPASRDPGTATGTASAYSVPKSLTTYYHPTSVPPYKSGYNHQTGATGLIPYSLNPSAIASSPMYTPYPYWTSYPPGLHKRQGTTFHTPECLGTFSSTYGLNGISNACDCLDIETPAPVTSTISKQDPSITVTSTSTIRIDGTTTIFQTPRITTITRTTTHYSTTTQTTEVIDTIASSISTITVFSTTTVTLASPTPSSFKIYYSNTTSDISEPHGDFLKAVTAPGGSGIVLTPETEADLFGLDSLNRLIDISDGRKFISKDTRDLYPIEYLRTTANSHNTPTCTACNGTLQCEYPGSTGNTFALCYGYLALGQPNIFGKDSNHNGQVDCIPIHLHFKIV